MKFIIKKRLLYSLIIPYVLIVGVTISGYAYSYSMATHRIKSDYLELSRHALDNMIREIDYGMKDIINLSIDIGGSAKVRRLAGIELPMNHKDKYEIAMAVQELGKMKQHNNFIENNYIYFKQGDFAIGNKYYYEPTVIYEEVHKVKGATYESWKEDVSGYYPMGQVKLIGGKLAYIVTPLLGAECNIVMLLNTDRLELLIRDYEEMQQARVTLTNDKGERLLENENNEIMEWDEENCVIINQASKEVNLYYSVYIPKKLFAYQTRPLLWMLSLMIIIFVSLLIVGLILIKRNYTNIMGLIKKFALTQPSEKEKDLIGHGEAFSEVACIENILDTLQTNIHNQQEIVVENIIRRALNGIVDEQMDMYFKHYGEGLFSNYFVVGIIEPIGLSTANGAEKQFDEFVIHNVISEMLKGYAKVYVITSNNHYVVVIDLGEEPQEEGMEYILDTLQRSKKFLAEHMDFKYTLSVSGIYRGMEELDLAYKEAKRGIEYKIVLGSKKIIYCTELYEHGENYQYSMKMEMQLINDIKSGQLHRALVTIEYLFEVNFAENNLSIESTKCFINDLYSTLVKIAKQMQVKIEWMPLELLKEVGTIQEMKGIIEEVVEQICEAVKQKKNVDTGEKGGQIIAYIHSHYTDANLNVTSIAEAFGFNSSYLSRLFKEQTGGNLLTYINQYRIQKVKDLLIETEHTLNEIAEKVGFINSVSVIRTFKKYEGMTPIQYRTLNKVTK